MARQTHRSQLAAIHEIIMTPMIDMSFLLLVTFMITVPLMEYGVDVSPPEMNAEPLPEEDSRVVNLNRNGQIVFNKKVIDAKMLMEELMALRRINNKLTVLIRADGGRKYSEVMDLMKAVKAAGINNISLVTLAETQDDHF